MYLSYDDYEDMGGTLDETVFDTLCYEAQSFIDWETFNRLKNDETVPEEVMRCMFALINLINSKRLVLLSSTTSGEGITKSISNDGVTQTYSVFSPEQLYAKMNTEISSIIKRYLSGVKNSKNKLVLYRGLYEDE